MEIEDLFPALRGASYQITSPRDAHYNCVAWAAGATNQWWWPLGDEERVYWPPGAPRFESVEAFQLIFEGLGYTVCETGDLEEGWEKVAFYADVAGAPTHVARQLPDGYWTSKLGQLEDIRHQLSELEGSEYGAVALVLRRPSLAS